jgi:hypothetical protein
MNGTAALTQSTAKVLLVPVDHFVGARLSRRQWAASLAERSSDEPTEWCQHSHGHKTIAAAKSCGVQMWNQLPKGNES